MTHAHIGLTAETRKIISDKLSVVLSNQFLLYIKTLKFHWNIYGPDFKPLHLFLEEQYEDLLDMVDDTAERIRTLDYMAPGTAKEFLSLGELTEKPGENPPALEMLKILLEDHESIIRLIRKQVDATMELGDAGTNNFLCDMMERHEKMAWMLRSFLQ